MTALPTSMSAEDVARETAPSSAEQFYAHRLEQLREETAPGDDQVVRLDLLRDSLRAAAGCVAPDMRTPFFALVERMRATTICPRCNKTRVLLTLSASYQRHSEERPDPKIHCACPGGPAYAGVGARFVDRSIVAKHQLMYCLGVHGPLKYIEPGTAGRITNISGRIATIAFDGHAQPYQHNADRIADIVELVPSAEPATDGGSR